jgi:hypothetical protein
VCKDTNLNLRFLQTQWNSTPNFVKHEHGKQHWTILLNTKTPHTTWTEQQSARNIITNEPLRTGKKCITKLNTQISTTPNTGNMYNFIFYIFINSKSKFLTTLTRNMATENKNKCSVTVLALDTWRWPFMTETCCEWSRDRVALSTELRFHEH